MRILYVSGQPDAWDTIDIPLIITCLNLPGVVDREHISHHSITYIDGDGCNMKNISPGDYDLIFSNSVIEHVGGKTKRKQFADEILRVSGGIYSVQTPY